MIFLLCSDSPSGFINNILNHILHIIVSQGFRVMTKTSFISKENNKVD